MATAFTVSNESKPNTAIRAIDAGGADAAPDTAYTIKITGTIDLTSVPTGLKPNRLHSRTETIPRPPHLLSAIRQKQFRIRADPLARGPCIGFAGPNPGGVRFPSCPLSGPPRPRHDGSTPDRRPRKQLPNKPQYLPASRCGLRYSRGSSWFQSLRPPMANARVSAQQCGPCWQLCQIVTNLKKTVRLC
jgi:hypothetical protein